MGVILFLYLKKKCKYILQFLYDEYQIITTKNYINSLYTYLQHFGYQHIHFFGWKDCVIKDINQNKKSINTQTDFLTRLQQQAEEIARSVLEESEPGTVAVTGNLFRRILLRDPMSDELSDAINLVQSESGEVPRENWTFLAHALLATNEFLHVD